MDRDVLQILTEDHAVLEWLAERLRAGRPGRARIVLFNEFARALGAHQTVIDQTVLPALKVCGWTGVSSDLLTGHVALKRLLAEALTLEREPSGFDEVVRSLAPQVKAQCELEQRKLLPVLLRCLDDEQRSLMALDAEQHLTRLLGETPKVHEDADFGPDAEDLVEQAYVVLGSLPGRRAATPARH
jgi:hypothetical protein